MTGWAHAETSQAQARGITLDAPRYPGDPLLNHGLSQGTCTVTKRLSYTTEYKDISTLDHMRPRTKEPVLVPERGIGLMPTRPGKPVDTDGLMH